MIQSWKDLGFYKEQDAKVNIQRKKCGYLRLMIHVWYGDERYCVLRYLRALRNYEFTINCTHGLLGKCMMIAAKIRWRQLGAKYNLTVNPNVVEYGLRIPHIVGGGIIHCRKMGHYCTINSGVIIGTNRRGELAEIGDNVDISIGSKVIGGVKVGNNVIIAPNSVVVKDVPDNTIVSGVPATILKYNG